MADCRHLIHTHTHVMIDIWLYSWPDVHLTIALTGVFTVHLCLHIIFALFQYIFFIVCSLYRQMHLPLLFYTLVGSLSDDPKLARPGIGCFLLLIRCSMRLDMFRGAGVSLYLFWYSCLPFYSCFCSLLATIYIRFVIIPFLYSL